jgi:ParB family chromosome partitioning protein
MAKNKGLGRDFYSLIDDNMPEAKSEAKTTIKISRITPRGDQPRKSFDDNALQILADSIREHGVIQPIVVRELGVMDDNYEIIAGERRWRAAKMAGLDEIPAVIMTGDELKKHYAGKLFDTHISRGVKLSEAPGFGLPVYYHDKKGKGTAEYLAVANELATRI